MSAPLKSHEFLEADEDPLVGHRYRALKRLGGGAMGDVFLAEHRELGSLCVAKIMHPQFAGNAQLIDRVRLEAQSLGRLNHPNIVSVLGAGRTADERPFIITELLHGNSVAEELKTRKSLPLDEALRYASQLLHALAAAHSVGIIHRDIKPENLFLCDEGQERFLKVLDFGIARIMPDAPTGAPQPLVVPTDTGVIIGTPRYVSPEGAAGRRVDHRADIYAAALVTFALVAGRGPFDDIRGAELLLSAHLEREPPPPSRFASDLPKQLDAILARALRKEPADRYQTADEFRHDLEQVSRDLAKRKSGKVATASRARSGGFAVEVVAASSQMSPPISRLSVALIFILTSTIVAVAVWMGIMLVFKGHL